MALKGSQTMEINREKTGFGRGRGFPSRSTLAKVDAIKKSAEKYVAVSDSDSEEEETDVLLKNTMKDYYRNMAETSGESSESILTLSTEHAS